MMIKPVTYKEIIVALGKMLDEYTGIAPTRILNADSIRGTDLAQTVSDTETYSPDAGHSFVLFELMENQNDDNFITKAESDKDMMTIQSYDLHFMIYGNASPTDSQKIAALFKNEDIVLELRDAGIYINGVLPIEPINEFINNTLLLRRDLIVKLQVRYEFKDIGAEPVYFKEDQDVGPIVKGISDAIIS